MSALAHLRRGRVEAQRKADRAERKLRRAILEREVTQERLSVLQAEATGFCRSNPDQALPPELFWSIDIVSRFLKLAEDQVAELTSKGPTP